MFDTVCTLCLQVQLYEDFAKSRAKVGVEDTISMASQEEEEKPKLKATGHVFQVQLVPCSFCSGSITHHFILFYQHGVYRIFPVKWE